MPCQVIVQLETPIWLVFLHTSSTVQVPFQKIDQSKAFFSTFCEWNVDMGFIRTDQTLLFIFDCPHRTIRTLRGHNCVLLHAGYLKIRAARTEKWLNCGEAKGRYGIQCQASISQLACKQEYWLTRRILIVRNVVSCGLLVESVILIFANTRWCASEMHLQLWIWVWEQSEIFLENLSPSTSHLTWTKFSHVQKGNE